MQKDRVMFFIGLAIIAVAAVLLLGNFMGDSTFPAILGFLGIVSIGASRYRPMTGKK